MTPPGRAVVDRVREAIGVENADEALFSLRGGGRLLVVGDGGAWVVSTDGSKRRLGDYREASWSPFGRYVVATREDELVALEPDGDVRWTLARPDVAVPRWGGSRSDTRIAYVTNGRLHVVGGDGSGDVDVGAAKSVAPAWRPGRRFVVAYATPTDDVVVYDVDARLTRSRRRSPGLTTLEWDGNRVVANASEARIRRVGQRSEIVYDGRVRFSGTGTFTDAILSPDGRWLLVAWRDANQWLFVSSRGPRRVHAVANVSEQFESSLFPDHRRPAEHRAGAKRRSRRAHRARRGQRDRRSPPARSR